MVRVNLLPWREQRRKEQQRQFYFMLIGGAVIAFLVMALIHSTNERAISQQHKRNDFIKQHIEKLNQKTKEIELLDQKLEAIKARIEIIQQLQENRVLIVHLFDEMARLVPEGVHLSQIKRQDDALTLDGIAESNIRVSTFLRQIGQSEWFKVPELIKIEAGDDESSIKFSLRVNHKMPYNQEDEVTDDGSQSTGA